MAGVERLDFDSPDQTRTPAAARIFLEPGWKWSECVKPIAGTDSCQAHHVGFGDERCVASE
jgi:hypothetical protein